jgi:hypothetical protein
LNYSYQIQQHEIGEICCIKREKRGKHFSRKIKEINHVETSAQLEHAEINFIEKAVYWIHLAQDRAQRRTVVNTRHDPVGFLNAWIVFISRTTRKCFKVNPAS